MKKTSFQLINMLITALVLFGSCKGKTSSSIHKGDVDKSPDTVSAIDSPIIEGSPPTKETPSQIFSESQLKLLMDSLYDKQYNLPENSQLVTGYGIMGNHIEISLIYYSEENVARFRKEIMDHPAFVFAKPDSKAAINKRKSTFTECKDCKVELELPTSTFTTVPGKIKLIMHNKSQNAIMTGEYYSIERYNGDYWEIIPFSLAFIDLGYGIPIGISRDFEINLHSNLYDYQPGKYRIIKDFHIESGTKPVNNHFYVSAEFYVQ